MTASLPVCGRVSVCGRVCAKGHLVSVCGYGRGEEKKVCEPVRGGGGHAPVRVSESACWVGGWVSIRYPTPTTDYQQRTYRYSQAAEIANNRMNERMNERTNE
eukprot:GHVU01176567.1.p1 GENE.GHVU01176567.1~~GHVU01176567.1.p1  ORF type:complete len:103 (-),score=13.47 GHVU01176567.1:53-361(-)